MLVYSTCTYNELENEQNLKWLREQHRVEFVKLSLETAWGVEEVQYSGILGYRCYPHRVYGEGFFFSVIRKTEAEESKSFRLKTSLPLASKKTKEQLQNWLTNQNQELLQLSDMLVAIPKEFTFEINVLSHQLNTVLRGTALATQKHDKFVPEHALAISRLLEQPNFPSLELSREETLTYLRKDVLIIGDGMKGFGLVTYQHVPLGWVNFLGNRINNLYPSSWRILMK
jgi:NOL1/NOP2/fmu family ribosome biogenesis protein